MRLLDRMEFNTMKASGIYSIGAALCLATAASAVDSFTVNITRTDGSGPLAPGGVFEFVIDGLLTQEANEGLAFFAFDLEVVRDGGGTNPFDLGTAILMQSGADVANFEQPLGYSVDFLGTPVSPDLIQLGGGQNTIGNCLAGPPCDPFPPFPTGMVDLGIGQGPGGAQLFIANDAGLGIGFTVPSDWDMANDGTYTFQIKPNSLFANVITSSVGGDFVVDPVDTVIGSSVQFDVLSVVCADVPQIAHGVAGAGETSPCSGYIDPRRESSNGVDFNEGLTEAFIKFNVEVFKPGLTDIDAGDFSMNETGGGTPPTVTLAEYVDVADKSFVRVQWDRPLTVLEWTTIVANVVNNCDQPILTSGDMGPGMDEPDRVDIGFMPGDLNQNGNTNPLDLNAFKQLTNFDILPNGCSDVLLDYGDINRNGFFNPLDLVSFKQLINGVGNATQSWALVSMNNPRP